MKKVYRWIGFRSTTCHIRHCPGIGYLESGIFLGRNNEELFALDDIDHVFSNNRIYVSETSLSWIEEQINNRPHP